MVNQVADHVVCVGVEVWVLLRVFHQLVECRTQGVLKSLRNKDIGLHSHVTGVKGGNEARGFKELGLVPEFFDTLSLD